MSGVAQQQRQVRDVSFVYFDWGLFGEPIDIRAARPKIFQYNVQWFFEKLLSPSDVIAYFTRGSRDLIVEDDVVEVYRDSTVYVVFTKNEFKIITFKGTTVIIFQAGYAADPYDVRQKLERYLKELNDYARDDLFEIIKHIKSTERHKKLLHLVHEFFVELCGESENE